jgi:ABC-type glycerol-3-phosphate transport system substrate-binding protein
MKKIFASVAAMLAVLAGLLLTAGTASATGGTTSPTFDCANVIGVGQICDNVDNVVVTVTHIGLLSGSDLVDVEDVLNDLAVTGINGDVNIIKGDILNLYHNNFSIPILSGNVIVIGWPTCGC